MKLLSGVECNKVLKCPACYGIRISAKRLKKNASPVYKNQVSVYCEDCTTKFWVDVPFYIPDEQVEKYIVELWNIK